MIFNTMLATSMQLIGVLATGAVPSSDEAADGLLVCNNLLDSLGTERENIFSFTTAPYPLASGVGFYNISPASTGTDIVAPRPTRIEKAGILIPNPGGTGYLRTPLTLLTEAQWASINDKNATGTTPTGLYYDLNFPIGGLNFYPVPVFASGSRQVELATWSILTQFATIASNVNLAPGYARFLTAALAIELAPQFNATVSEALLAQYTEAKAGMRALNAAMDMRDAPPTAVPLNAIPQAGPSTGGGQ